MLPRYAAAVTPFAVAGLALGQSCTPTSPPALWEPAAGGHGQSCAEANIAKGAD
jgi:hypothetical protein